MPDVLRNPYIKALLASAWLGLLALPFAGVTKALYVAGAVAIGSIVIVAGRVLDAAGTFVQVRAAGCRGQACLDTFARGTRRNIALALLLAFLVVLPFVSSRYTLDIATQTGIYIVLALGLNIVVGQTGLLVLGYVAFYGVGAYTYALLSTGLGVGFWAALPIAAIMAGIFGLMLGAPTLRLRGDYLAVVTLGFGEITRIVLNNWDGLTGGPNGVSGVPRPSVGPFVFTSLTHYYFLVLGMAIVTIFVVMRLNDSRIGRAWIAIREDEIAAEAMGVNTVKLKLLAFALGAVLAGLAGVFYVAKMGFVSPESFNFFESVIILCMVVLGGMGSIPGVVLGAVILYLLPEGLREFQQYRMLIFGAAMVVMMVFRPQGIIGTKRRGMEMAGE
ncbi:MAG: branched-chain amino acid ABC transporter permease [Nitrospirae bacterium]|nr:branched-chain amino acid ABC transporter permease [Nitrospirota bacterium]